MDERFCYPTAGRCSGTWRALQDGSEETVGRVPMRPKFENVAHVERNSFCREHLAHFKCPRSIDFTDALPRLPTGKLYKRLLRDAYWEGHRTSIV